MYTPFRMLTNKLKYESLTQGLSKKEKAFCEFYCNYGFSGVEAIYEAGYKPKDRKTAYAMSTENLRKPKILGYINEIYKNFQFSNEEVMHEHWYLIKQHHDLASKARGIDLFYRENSSQIVIARKYDNLSDAELDVEMEKALRLWATEKGYKIA